MDMTYDNSLKNFKFVLFVIGNSNKKCCRFHKLVLSYVGSFSGYESFSEYKMVIDSQ